MKHILSRLVLGCVIAMFLGTQSAQAETITYTGTVTADNYYAIYTGNPDSINFIGKYGDEYFQTAETFTFDVNSGDYIYVAAWNAFGAGQGIKGWLGQFVSDAETILSNTENWEVYLTNNSNAVINGSIPTESTVMTDLQASTWNPVTSYINSPYIWESMNGDQPIGGISADAQWIWGSDLLAQNNYGDYQLFRTQVPATEPVPEPASILLLASGLFGLAGFKKKKIR